MNKFPQLFLIGWALCFSSLSIASVNLQFINGLEFHDYEIKSHSRAKSLKVLEQDFTKLFEEVFASNIANGQQVVIAVIDLDLPGIFEDNLRVVGKKRSVRIDFAYRLMDAEKNILIQGKKRIQDKTRTSMFYRSFDNWKHTDLFVKPLEEWYQATFVNQ